MSSLLINLIMFSHLPILTLLLFLPLLTTPLHPTHPSHPLPLFVHDLDSRTTHLRFDYTYLKMCPAQTSLTTFKRQLPYSIEVLKSNKCEQVCQVSLREDEREKYRWMIEHNYQVFYTVGQEVPALYENLDTGQQEKVVSYDLGFPLGFRTDKTTYRVNNQIELEFWYRNITNSTDIEIHSLLIRETDCSTKFYLNQNTTSIPFFYSVSWKQSQQPLLASPDLSTKQRTQWLTFGFIINIIYCIAIASIIYKNLLSDLKHCAKHILGTTVEEFMELSEERNMGWKQHQREVFRPPRNRLILSVMVGAGAQVITVVVIALSVMAAKGYHYFELEDTQIALLLKQLLVYSSIIAGYACTRVYKMWAGQNWMGCAILTSLVLPLTLTISLTIENSMRLLEDAISYSLLEMFFMPVVWIIGAVPLGIIGGYIGFKRRAIKNPFSVHAVQQKRQYSFNMGKQLATGFLASLIPYLSFATQYRVLLDSFWQSNPFDMYFLLFISMLLLMISSGLASVFTTYQSLNKGNPKWWGIPFIISGGVAVCTLVAQTIYLIVEMNITRLTSIVIYFCWSFMLVWLVFLFCGASGFVITAVVVRKIYQMIKVD